MRANRTAFLTVAFPLTVIFAVALLAAPDQYAYAKGVVKSRSSHGDRESTSSNSRGEPSNQRDSRSSDSSSPPPSVVRPGERDSGSSLERLKGRPYLDTSPTARPGMSPVLSERSEFCTTNPSSSYRKEYADIGRIWKERRERRDTASDSSRRDHDARPDRRVHVHINYYFPGTYRYYVFDYLPGYCYPSLYCYYYGIFPPYIRSYRVIYVHREHIAPYVYIDLPIMVVHHGYDYYDTYYLADWKYRSLSSALRDIERAWERGDINLLMDHVRRSSRIDVYLRGEYAYSIDRQDYYEMTLDAMTNIRTVEFDLYRIRQRGSYEVVAYGRHTYYDDYLNHPDSAYDTRSTRKTVYVTYTLERFGDEWYITEVGSSPSQLY